MSDTYWATWSLPVSFRYSSGTQAKLAVLSLTSVTYMTVQGMGLLLWSHIICIYIYIYIYIYIGLASIYVIFLFHDPLETGLFNVRCDGCSTFVWASVEHIFQRFFGVHIHNPVLFNVDPLWVQRSFLELFNVHCQACSLPGYFRDLQSSGFSWEVWLCQPECMILLERHAHAFFWFSTSPY